MEAAADSAPGTPTGAPDDGGRIDPFADPFAAAARENFPVASRLIRADLRPAVVAFYRFARAADDVADDPSLSRDCKLARLDNFEAGLSGGGAERHAVLLRRAVADHPRREGLIGSARALLGAFRQDARGAAYPDWAALRAYCAMSAEPVGRFLLDLHEEGPEAHPPSDALCSALQVLNHLQDLRADHDGLGRVYLPVDWVEGSGARLGDLSAASLSPALRAAVDLTLDACDGLLRDAAALPGLIRSRGLRAQAAATLFLARRLSARLRRGDPLAGRIHPSAADFAIGGVLGAWCAVRRPA